MLIKQHKMGFPEAQDKLGDHSVNTPLPPLSLNPKIWAIPYWIDPTGAPDTLTKDMILKTTQKAAKAWEACGEKFVYKGFKPRPEYGAYGEKESPDVTDPIVSWLKLPDETAGITWTISDETTKQPIRWSIELSPESTDSTSTLLAVATHELGHALGISHSRNKHSIMYSDQNAALRPTTRDLIECQRLLSHWDPELAASDNMARVQNELPVATR